MGKSAHSALDKVISPAHDILPFIVGIQDTKLINRENHHQPIELELGFGIRGHHSTVVLRTKGRLRGIAPPLSIIDNTSRAEETEHTFVAFSKSKAYNPLVDNAKEHNLFYIELLYAESEEEDEEEEDISYQVKFQSRRFPYTTVDGRTYHSNTFRKLLWLWRIDISPAQIRAAAEAAVEMGGNKYGRGVRDCVKFTENFIRCAMRQLGHPDDHIEKHIKAVVRPKLTAYDGMKGDSERKARDKESKGEVADKLNRIKQGEAVESVVKTTVGASNRLVIFGAVTFALGLVIGSKLKY